MDIKNKPTLAEKQAFWAEQLPNFESKYWLPSHFELLEFDMEGGNYEVRDVLPENYSEDDATEIWHRVNTGWAMWKKAINFTKAQAVPEGFVLIPQEPTELFKEHLKNHLFDLWAGDHGCDWDGFVSVDAINHNTIWKMMIEAQEQSHDSESFK